MIVATVKAIIFLMVSPPFFNGMFPFSNRSAEYPLYFIALMYVLMKVRQLQGVAFINRETLPLSQSFYPEEVLLAALASCQEIVYRAYAAMLAFISIR